ncbi:hypothetical protein PG637_04395 [Riemerella anatipestifer]|nr:hypothetical protein [Riemerella anatipestifer]MDY3324914.1 hypothetical protein [Riemerella anatipestifer]MDY3353723.1 hypothetical protein [Riemerella anatipestifer]
MLNYQRSILRPKETEALRKWGRPFVKKDLLSEQASDFSLGVSSRAFRMDVAFLAVVF